MSDKKIIDANDQILGRFASKISKKLLNGEKIEVINSNGLVITGKPENIIKEYLNRRKRGDPHHGPYYPKDSKNILRRTVRGMLPYKKSKGKEALSRLKIFNNNPEGKEGKKISKERYELTCKYITLKELSKRLKRG